MKQPTLFDPAGDDGSRPDPPPDQAARDFAVDPSNHVMLEASAGTGKTRVLVDRYVRLVVEGVAPRHILAITFTRKAAAEMRERVLAELRRKAAERAIPPARWRELMDRVGDIQISTIDAFCFSLLREFPLEANVDPAFDVADETEMARFANEAMDLTLRAARPLMQDDESVRLLFARVKTPVLVNALRSLIDRRHVALPAVRSFVGRDTRPRSSADIGAAFVGRLRDAVASSRRSSLVDDGPHGAPAFRWIAADIASLVTFPADDAARVQLLRRRFERYFLVKNGSKARERISKPILPAHFSSPEAKRRHEQALGEFGPSVFAAIRELDRDIDRLLARGLLRVLAIAGRLYEQLLEDHALLDFAAMLERSVVLLERQEEFARSRLKLQARYHHVLVDEFQDTSRLQWRLIELLIRAWGEGEGASEAPTSIFVVGDRKQSIYRFRHAEVTLLDEAARHISALRPERDVRRAITTSFRSVPELLAFVNALGSGMAEPRDLAERFSYEERDRFPVPPVLPGARRDGEPVLGLIAEASMEASAAAVADEIAGIIGRVTVRDRQGGTRPARPDDIAILFRARAGHQYYEDALDARGVRTYVYKGLGFFDAPEVQDLQALLRYLATPDSDLAAAELLRSRLVRLSDVALARLAPGFADALAPGDPAAERAAALDETDRATLGRTRASVARWLALADRVPPSELLDLVLRESAYAFELRGRRFDQARENVKKVRALVRRVENRGYATLGRLAGYFDALRAGDESNAIVEAAGAVNLMTMHAAKGLEFPIVFLVNLHAGGRGGSSAVSVIERGVDGLPEVAFRATDGTALEDLRDDEELRRLLYVAATRARDRLYLAAEVDERGHLKRSGKGLAAFMPPALAGLFPSAAAHPGASEVVWTAGDATFAFKICRPRAEPVILASATPSATLEASSTAPVVATGPRIVAATEPAPPRAAPDTERTGGDRGPGHQRLIGTLVHRLFQRRAEAGMDVERLAIEAERLATPEERVDIADLGALAREAARIYRDIRRRPEVAALLEVGECFHEVPFSYEAPGRPLERVRGAIDCLVLEAGGAVTVLEFKTGLPRPEHEEQAALYAAAIRAALGRQNVSVRVLYA